MKNGARDKWHLLKLRYHQPLGVLRVERRDAAQGAVLRAWLGQRVIPEFAGRILPVDQAVALRCAQLHVPDPRPMHDALIAATALVHGLTVVTRNITDFAPLGVALLDPWQDQNGQAGFE